MRHIPTSVYNQSKVKLNLCRGITRQTECNQREQSLLLTTTRRQVPLASRPQLDRSRISYFPDELRSVIFLQQVRGRRPSTAPAVQISSGGGQNGRRSRNDPLAGGSDIVGRWPSDSAEGVNRLRRPPDTTFVPHFGLNVPAQKVILTGFCSFVH